MIAYSYSRLSSDKQADGDGLRRQEDTVEKYCRRMKLDLQKKTLRDIGLSGYHAEHLKRGALGVFLMGVSQKKVATPCALVIESLDRLSRQEPLDAMGLLIDIVKKGVEIHTTMDGAIYKEGLKMGAMMSGLLSLCTGHEESDKKSTRHKAMWDEKRANAKKEIITRACPSWLKPKKDKSGFVLIPERAAIIREIFELTASGIGRTKIADHLNAKNTATWNGGIRWHASFIQKLMANTNVLGHLRTGSWVNGKYVPGDQLIENYYPAVITQADWDAAHSSRAARTRQYNRYDENTARDMVSGLVHINGVKAYWRNKGRRNPQGIYQIYYKTFDPATGKVIDSVRREMIEMQLLVEIAELDPANLVRTPVADSTDLVIQELEATIAKLGKGIERMVDKVAEGLSSPAIDKRIVDDGKSLERAKKQLSKVARDTSDLDRANEAIPKTIQQINELALVDDDSETRQAVSRNLHEILERIDLYIGLGNFPAPLKKEYRNYNPAVPNLTVKEDYTAYCLQVAFINGTVTQRVTWYTEKPETYG